MIFYKSFCSFWETLNGDAKMSFFVKKVRKALKSPQSGKNFKIN